ncbi:MAG: hypothetical protein IJX13_02720 [Clostridia bacterium]|nr:hypothetical protein [Clostridia bacterium]
MKSAFTEIVGNRRLKERLCADILSNRLSHAYIIDGGRGSGKHTLALSIAAAVACECKKDGDAPLPCRTCSSCKKILSGNSPDVIYISKGDRATLGVETIRELKSDVYIAPNDISAKIYIIEDAHLMTKQAQNAFLLTLEEPPPYVLFLLLCEGTEALLETVRSRAPTLRTEPIGTDEIGEYLIKAVPEAKRIKSDSPDEWGEILAAADGSIGRAIALLDPKAYKPIVEKRRAAREFVTLCAEKKSSTDAMRFLLSFSKKSREGLAELWNETLLCLRDLLLLKQTENAPLCFFFDREEALSLAYSFTTPRLLSLCDGVSRALESLRRNANVRLTLMALATDCGLL